MDPSWHCRLFFLFLFAFSFFFFFIPSVLWHCWLGVRKSIWPVQIEWWGVGVVICLEQGADCLHMAIPKLHHLLKSRLVLPFWYWLTQVVMERRPLNGCSSSNSSSLLLLLVGDYGLLTLVAYYSRTVSTLNTNMKSYFVSWSAPTTVLMTAEGTLVLEAWTRRSVTSDLWHHRKTLTYCLTHRHDALTTGTAWNPVLIPFDFGRRCRLLLTLRSHYLPVSVSIA